MNSLDSLINSTDPIRLGYVDGAIAHHTELRQAVKKDFREMRRQGHIIRNISEGAGIATLLGGSAMAVQSSEVVYALLGVLFAFAARKAGKKGQQHHLQENTHMQLLRAISPVLATKGTDAQKLLSTVKTYLTIIFMRTRFWENDPLLSNAAPELQHMITMIDTAMQQADFLQKEIVTNLKVHMHSFQGRYAALLESDNLTLYQGQASAYTKADTAWIHHIARITNALLHSVERMTVPYPLRDAQEQKPVRRDTGSLSNKEWEELYDDGLGRAKDFLMHAIAICREDDALRSFQASSGETQEQALEKGMQRIKEVSDAAEYFAHEILSLESIPRNTGELGNMKAKKMALLAIEERLQEVFETEDKRHEQVLITFNYLLEVLRALYDMHLPAEGLMEHPNSSILAE